MRTLRLAILMAFGACIGNVLSIGPGNARDLAVESLETTLFGAFAGLVIEGMIRVATSAGNATEKQTWSFGLRDLLIAVAIVSIALWTIIALWKM